MPVEVLDASLKLWPCLLPLLQERLAGREGAAPVVLGAAPGEARVLVTPGKAVTREVLESRPRVTCVVVPHAGIGPNVAEALAAAGRGDIRIYNSHHNGKSTGELALALLLALSRRVVPADALLRRNDWSYKDDVKLAAPAPGCCTMAQPWC